jgi:iron complex outermembrane receptor protein
MKKVYFLLAGTIVSVHTGVGNAQTNVDQSLEHVLVTAPLHKTDAETALPVTVLDGDQLRNVVSSSLGETLMFEPGISNTSYGPGVGKPVIRGQTGPRVLILQNGLAAQDASTLSPDHANAVEPFLAERIEVIKGPASLLYGNGAIGGVVNVIDRRIPSTVPETVEGSIGIRYDSVDDRKQSMFKLDAGEGAFAVHVDGLYSDNNDVRIPGDAISVPGEITDDSTSGYIGNSSGRNSSITGGVSLVQDWGYIGASASRLQTNYGIPPGVHEGHDHEHADEEPHEDTPVRIDLEQDRFDLKAEIYHPVEWMEVSRIHLANTRYEHRELEGSEVGTRYANDAWNLRWEMVHHTLAGWHGAFGLDAGTRNFAASGEEVFVPESDTRNIGIFLLEDRHYDNFSIELGLRSEYQQVDPQDQRLEEQSFTSWTASAAVIWSLNDYNNFTVALSGSQRPPFAEELYSNVVNIDSGVYVEHGATGAVEIGDPQLGNETSINFELGWTHFGESYNASVNLFYNNFGDYIYLRNTDLLYNPQECPGASICGPDQADEGAPVLVYEQESALFRGIEAEVNIPLWPRGAHEFSVDVFGDYTRATLEDSNQDVPRMPPARIGTRFNYAVGNWSGLISAMHGFAQNRPGANESDTSSYTRLDAAAYYDFAALGGDWQAYIKANNLANAEIRNSASYLRNYAPEPGRGIELGVNFSF